MPTQKNLASWDLQLGFNLAFKRLMRISKFQLERLHLYELKRHKPWFDEECLHFLDQKKHAKIQWLQDPNQSNVDNLINLT
jgi:hypothetical protein